MSKISELSNGGALLATDDLIVVRSGGNVRAQLSAISGQSVSATTLSASGATTLSSTLTVNGDASISSANARLRLFETDTTNLNTQIQNQAGDFKISRLDDDAGGSTVQLTIDHATGNVGIGTSSPQSIVHIDQGASDAQLTLETHSGGDSKIVFSQGQTAGNWAVGYDDGGGVTDNSLSFAYKADGYPSLSGQNKMILTPAGNVGIGNSSPSSYFSNASSLVVGGTTGANGMTISGSTDTQIFFADGTSGADAYRGIIRYSHSDNALSFWTDATERMRILSNGSVVIGGTSQHAASATTIDQDGSFRSVYASGVGGDTFIAAISGVSNGHQITCTSGNALTYKWHTGANAQAMTLDSSGNVFIGSISSPSSSVAGVRLVSPTDRPSRWSIGSSTADTSLIQFLNGNGVIGSISTTASATAYNTSSDYRLKENVVAITGATERLKQLNPSRFNFIADADTTVDGFLAHEVQAVVPEAITGTKDAMRDEEYEVTPAVLDDDGNVTTEAVMGTRSVPDYQGIDQSKLVPLLVATIQELEARLTALENT